MHVDGVATISNKCSRIGGAGHIRTVGHGPHAIVFIPIGHRGSTDHAFAVLLLDLGRVLEQTF